MTKRRLAFLLALSLSFSYPALAADNGGLTVDDNSGNTFMEEVIDPEQQAAEEKERTRIRAINRRTLTEQELKNVGIQMSPSGSLVPLINKDQNAGPIKHYSSQIDQSFQALPAPVLPYYPGRLNLYGAGVNPYASGLNPYWTGLNPYGAGLNLYTNSLNLNGTSLNTSRALNPTTRQIIGKAIPFANAAIGNLPAELNGRFNPPFPGLVPPLLPSRTNFLNGPLFNPYPSLPYTSQGLYGFRGNTGLFFSGTREVQTTTSLTPFLPDWLTH